MNRDLKSLRFLLTVEPTEFNVLILMSLGSMKWILWFWELRLVSLFRTTFPAFPANKLTLCEIIVMFSIWHHIRPSTHALLNSVANQNGGILTGFDEPYKIRDLTKTRTFVPNYFTKKFYYFSGKKFGGLGALQSTVVFV